MFWIGLLVGIFIPLFIWFIWFLAPLETKRPIDGPQL